MRKYSNDSSGSLLGVSSPAVARQDAAPQQKHQYQRHEHQIQHSDFSPYGSASPTFQRSPQHVNSAATREKLPGDAFPSRSPYSNVEEAGKNILRSARQRLDARRNARQKAQLPSTVKSLPKPRTSSPSVRDLKRQLWSKEERLQSSTSSVPKFRHSMTAQTTPSQYTDPSNAQRKESSSLSQRSYRSLSPSRARKASHVGSARDTIDPKPTAQAASGALVTTPTRHDRTLFHSKYYVAARAAQLRDKKVQEEQRFRSTSRSFSSSNENGFSTNTPTLQASPIQPYSQRSRSLSRSFSNENSASTAVSKQQSGVLSHQASHLRSSPQRSRSFSKDESNSPPRNPTSARGRLANMALEKGLSRKNSRSQSPFIEERIRRFSRDRSDNLSKSPQNQQLQRIYQPQQEDGEWNDRSDRTLPRKNHGVSPRVTNQKEVKTRKSIKGAFAREEQSDVAAFRNGNIHRIPSSPRRSIKISQIQVHKPEERKESNASESNSHELDLMARLNAVNRANPARALAQIDLILRQESQKKSLEPILINPIIGTDDDSAGTTISSLTNPDYRDWQHQEQMQAKHNLPNQVGPFRGPRPSSLQNYTSATSPKDEVKNPRKDLQKHPQESIPPSSLGKVKAMQMKKASKSAGVGKVDDRGSSTTQGELVQFFSHPTLPKPSPLPTRRSHPWDDDAPDIASASISIPQKDGKSVIRDDVDAELEKHEDAAHTRSKGPAQNPEVKKEINADPSGLSSADVKVNSSKAVNFTPNQPKTAVSPRKTPQQYETAKQISDKFDAAWALMPGGDFSPSEGSNGRQGLATQSSRSSRHLNSSFDNSANTSRKSKSYHSRSAFIPEDSAGQGVNGEKFSIEVSLYDPDPTKSSKSKSKRRGFFRSLVRRQNGKKASTASTNSESLNSTGMHSASQTSSAAPSHSTPCSIPSGRSSSASSPRLVHIKSRQSSRKAVQTTRPTPTYQSQTSTESIDRFRTASIAQKYSRVMRLYDDE